MIDPSDALAVLRAVTPGEPSSPELAAALVTLATIEATPPGGRTDEARLGPGAHVGAATRFRWLLERQTAPAADAVMAAAAVAVAEHIAAQDPTGDLVPIPVSACRVINRLDDVIAESPHPTIVSDKHPLVPILRRSHHVLLNPARLPAGHKLLGIEPAVVEFDGYKMAALFVGGPATDRGQKFPGCCASVKEAAYATEFFRIAADALRERKAKERAKWEADRVKEQERHQAAMAAARKIAAGTTAADVALDVDALKAEVAALREAAKMFLNDKQADLAKQAEDAKAAPTAAP